MRLPFDDDPLTDALTGRRWDDPMDPFGFDRPDPWFEWRPTHCDTSRRADSDGVALGEIQLPRAHVPEPPRPEQISHTVALELVTTDGVPCSDIALTVRSSGFEGSATTDADGLAMLEVPCEDDYEITFAERPLRLPPRPEEPPPSGPTYLRRIARDSDGVTIPSDDRRRIVVVRPAVTEILLDGYAEGSSVMRWGGTRVRKDGSVGTARAALRIALWIGRGKTMAVLGHADPLGQDADNDALSAARARSVQLYAAGDLDGWAEDAVANATELDLACALVATTRILGEAPIAVDDAHAMERALAAVRVHASLPSNGPANADDWRAIAELYDDDLAAMLVTDRAGLAAIRSTIGWTTPATLGLGERYPRPESELEPTLAGPSALAHRRCSLCVFGPTDTPQAAIDADAREIYDGTYARTVIDPPGEAWIEIAVGTPTHDPIARARAWIGIGQLGTVHMTAEEDGVIRFAALIGERISVTAAFDAEGRGTLVDAGTHSVPA